MASNKGSGFWNSIQEDLLSFFELNDFRSYSMNQVYKAFAVRDRKTKEIFSEVIEYLAKENRLDRLSDGSFQYLKQANQVVGKLDHVNQRLAFVIKE